MRLLNNRIAVCVLVGLGSTAARAELSTVDQVVQYAGGALAPTSYYGASYGGTGSSWTSGPGIGLPQDRNNIPNDLDNGIYGDTGIISPFNAQYTPGNIVGMGGSGGVLEVHLSKPVATNGFTLGVHAGVGLNDVNYPNGETGSFGAGGVLLPNASAYTDPRSAEVLVSAVGGSNPADWVALNGGSAITFDVPSNYYSDITSSFPSSAGSTVADFGKPFVGSLSSFDGNLDLAGVLNKLGGSAGGTWLDLSGTGLAQVNYVEFVTSGSEKMFVNSVVGVVPEPGSLLAISSLAVVGIVSSRRRKV